MASLIMTAAAPTLLPILLPSVNIFITLRGISVGALTRKWYFRRFWNVLYNSLLNTNFSHGTTVIAFADDLLVLTRGKSDLDAEKCQQGLEEN